MRNFKCANFLLEIQESLESVNSNHLEYYIFLTEYMCLGLVDRLELC